MHFLGILALTCSCRFSGFGGLITCNHVDLGSDTAIKSTRSSHVETVVSLSLKKDIHKIEVAMQPSDESNYMPKEKATYPNIKQYIKDKYGVNVHTSYIAEVKRMCGIDMGENYHKSKKENPKVKHCPQEKIGYIKEALEHYGLL